MAFKPGHAPVADYPALPLWTDRYFADTRHLTRDQHGAYILLLMEAWRRPSCSLPDDDALLSRLTCSTLDEWALLKSTIMAFWKLDGRTKEWTQKALTKEREYLVKQSKSQRDRAAKRWNKTENTDAGAMPKRYPADAPTPTPTPTSSPTEKRPTVSDELSKVLDEAHVKAVIEHRKGFRGKFTPHAADLLAKKFARCPDPNAAADAMISNNWQGFEPEWLDRRQVRGSPGRPLTGLAAIEENFRRELENDGYGQGEESSDPEAHAGLPLLTRQDH